MDKITTYQYCLNNNLKVIGLELDKKFENDFYYKPLDEGDHEKLLLGTDFITLEEGVHQKSELYLELRMFTLVPYNIMGIQKGIQHEHSVTQYLVDFVIDADTPDERAKRWARSHKTVIVLNGGTSNEGHFVKHIEGEVWYEGTMQKARTELKEMGVKFSEFYEPDLNSMLTGLSFILDERVFDSRTYPDYKPKTYEAWCVENLKQGDNSLVKYEEEKKEAWNKYLDMVGGIENHNLRLFKNKYRLA